MILVLTDNQTIYSTLSTLLFVRGVEAVFRCSPGSFVIPELQTLDIKTFQPELKQLIISGHCKQIFPAHVVKTARCINIHPGFNPFNRGWYPQVFSLQNGLPIGATIHEMDEQLDHGPIIAQELVEVEAWDTSKTAYEKVMAAEVILLHRHIDSILAGDYKTFSPRDEGNVNRLRAFKNLCEIDPSEKVTFQQAINRIRSLSHPPHKNAFFTDPKTHRKVYVRIELTPEEVK